MCSRRRQWMVLSALALFALAACASKYNWQAFHDDSNGYSVDFPAKVQLDQQDIDVNGGTLPLRTQSATANGSTFAIGAVSLPSGDLGQRDAALASIEDGIRRNSGHISATSPFTVTVKSGKTFTGHQWHADGTVAGTGQARVVDARFVATDTQVYELVIVGDHAQPKEQAARFFDSFKPD